MNEPNVRKLDELGRIVLPTELRAQLDWQEQDSIQITLLPDQSALLLARPHPVYKCALCGCKDPTLLVPVIPDRCLCKSCMEFVRTLPTES